ncbi:hypothetical protein M9458_029629, partial [Cirrhinus mrigala]
MAAACRADAACPEAVPWTGAMGRTRQAAAFCAEYPTITSPPGEPPKPPHWTPIEGGEEGGV